MEKVNRFNTNLVASVVTVGVALLFSVIMVSAI